MENQQHSTQSASSDEAYSFEAFEQEEIAQPEVNQAETPADSFFKRFSFDPASVFETIKQSYIARTVFILLAVWLGIKLLGRLVSPRSRHEPITAPITTLPSRIEVSSPNEVGEPHISYSRLPLSEQVASNNLEARLTKVQASLDQLNFQLSGLQNKWVSLEGRITQIRDSMQPVHQWIQKQLQSVNKVVKKEADSKEKSRQALYNLRAIQKGRAWLSTQNGEELTVQEGDLIPGYGVVLLIDFVNKLVKLDNGIVFGFSNNPALDSVSSSI